LAVFESLQVVADESDQGRGIAVKTLPEVNPAGKQWLVLIGIDDYTNNYAVHDLKSCKSDMEALRDLLMSRFGYQRENVVELYDSQATVKGIQRTIYDLLKKVGVNDTVVIAYAGHGYFDKDTRLGCWFPSDIDSPADGIPNSTIRDWCAAFKANKVLVIADSCFSGSLLSREGFSGDATLKSRELLAAGGLQPVADSGSPDGLHSVFNHYLRWSLTRLADEGKPFVTNDLYVLLYAPVKVNSHQEPQKGIMEGAFHEGGQFLFYPSVATKPFKPVVSKPVTLPSSGAASFDDIEKAAEEQKEAAEAERRAKDSWAAWQTEREREFSKVKVLEGNSALTPEQKAVAWDRIMAALSQNNPYSTEDDSMRKYCRSRSNYWNEEDARLAGEVDGNDIESDPIEVAQGTDEKAFTNSLGMRFVYCPPGTFLMGSPASEQGRQPDENTHKVTLTKGFYIQITEVTQGQWKKVMGNNPSHFSSCGDSCPVEQVSWEDVQEFLGRLNGKERTAIYRLPTEAEWEYACRSGSSTIYYWGNARGVGAHAWYDGNSGETPHSVAKKTPNAWGIYDMIGNVWEWCSDWYDSNLYANYSQNDPKGPNRGSLRVNRGGSWGAGPAKLRSADRSGIPPVARRFYLGFRVAASHTP